jgi:hypothetical protein
LTSLPVHNAAEASQIITWYSYRWLIERLHYVLKSGCKLEESQLRHEARLERLLAGLLASVVTGLPSAGDARCALHRCPPATRMASLLHLHPQLDVGNV